MGGKQRYCPHPGSLVWRAGIRTPDTRSVRLRPTEEHGAARRSTQITRFAFARTGMRILMFFSTDERAELASRIAGAHEVLRPMKVGRRTTESASKRHAGRAEDWVAGTAEGLVRRRKSVNGTSCTAGRNEIRIRCKNVNDGSARDFGSWRFRLRRQRVPHPPYFVGKVQSRLRLCLDLPPSINTNAADACFRWQPLA